MEIKAEKMLNGDSFIASKIFFLTDKTLYKDLSAQSMFFAIILLLALSSNKFDVLVKTFYLSPSLYSFEL